MGVDEADAARKRQLFEEKWGERATERSSGMLFGTPRQAVDAIGAYAEAGAQGLNIALRAPFDWESLQAFIEEVMPAFS